MSNIERYREIFYNTLCLDKDFDVEKAKRNETENWDSVGHISLISNIEDEFNIMFEMDDILGFRSYNNGLIVLKKYGVELE